MMKKTISTILAFILGFSLTACTAENDSVNNNENSKSVKIIEIVPDKAQYNPNDTAKLTVSAENTSKRKWSGKAKIIISHLEKQVDEFDCRLDIAANSTANAAVEWNIPENDFTGYYVKAVLGDSTASTAIDCSSDTAAFPRYGYVAEYDGDAEKTRQTDETIKNLSTKYHINAYQFYDWQWRHDDYVKYDGKGNIEKEWNDLFGRKISSDTVKSYINTMQKCNSKALAYVQSYTAREDYEKHGVSVNDALFRDSSGREPWCLDFGKTKLYQFNPGSKIWQKKMMSEYLKIINDMGFDGLQIDQLGDNGTMYDRKGNIIDYASGFQSLVNNAKNTLKANNPKKSIVTFNMVGGWPKQFPENAQTDFNYSELWSENESYKNAKTWIETARKSGKKSFVLAAYMNYNDNPGEIYEAEKGVLEGGAAVATDHSGYSGDGFVDHLSDKGTSVTFTIDAPESGTYSIVLAYSNGTDQNATRNLYIDGKKVWTAELGSTGSWDQWSIKDKYFNAELEKGKHTVKLSYDDGNTGAMNLDSITLGTFSENAIRLADAFFAACGASHIELGAKENNITMLSNEYYPNTRLVMRSNHIAAMKNHYDFITAYENLLFGSDISDNENAFTIDGERLGTGAEKDEICLISRKNGDYDIINLVNLTGENNESWRDATGDPVKKENLKAKYYIGDENAAGVYMATPDRDSCESRPLEYKNGEDSRGKYIEFTIPSLEYWDMIYIAKK